MEKALTRLALAAALLLGATDADAGTRTYRVARAAVPPRLDGVLDDPCWKKALTLTDFALLGRPKRRTPLPTTSAMLAYDADYLYVAYRCAEPLADRLVLKATKHDGKTWADDCVEMFFDPTGRRRAYVQIVVNAAGVATDASFDAPSTGMNLGYETGIEAKTRIGKGEWTLEARIPFCGLPLTGRPTAWAFHLARTRAAAGQHLTMLESPTSGFHEVAKFDRLEGIALPERPVAVTNPSLGDLYRGENIASVDLTNHGAAPVRLAAAVGLAGQGDKLSRQADLRPGESKTVAVPWTLGQKAVGHRVAMDVRLGPRLLRRVSVPIARLPEVLGTLRRNACFIRSDAVVRLELPVRIAAGTRRDAELRWQAVASDGRVAGRGLTMVRGPNAVVRLYWPRWRPDRYTLRFELLRGKDRLASAEHTLLLVEHPLGDR